jgi:hypothetical protein
MNASGSLESNLDRFRELFNAIIRHFQFHYEISDR